MSDIENITCWHCGTVNRKPAELAEKLCGKCHKHLNYSQCKSCNDLADHLKQTGSYIYPPKGGEQIS